MKKMNAYLPLWFMLLLPPLSLMLLASNLILSAVAIILTAVFLGLKNPFDEYYKKTFKIFFISLIPTFIIGVMYFIPQLLRINEFLYKHFVYHLEYNPYKSIWTILYMILTYFIAFKVTYKFTHKHISKIKNTTKIKRKQATIIMTFLIIPYILFVPSSLLIKKNKSNLDDFKGTVIGDRTSIVQILKQLKTTENISSYMLETKKEPYTINIFVSDIEYCRKNFEMDAAVIFNLVDNLNEVVFFMGEDEYTYTINDINNVFGNIKKKTLKEINDRYIKPEMTEYIYLGRLKEYDIYDTYKGDERTFNSIFHIANTHYYLNTNKASDVIAVKNGKKYILSDILKTDEISYDEVLEGQLNIIVAGEQSEEDTNK